MCLDKAEAEYRSEGKFTGAKSHGTRYDSGSTGTALSEFTNGTYDNGTSQIRPDFPPPDINHCLTWRRFAK